MDFFIKLSAIDCWYLRKYVLFLTKLLGFLSLNMKEKVNFIVVTVIKN